MRFILTENVCLITDGLNIYKDTVLDEVPLLALNAFVVVSDRAKRTGLCFIGDNVDQITSIFKVAGLQFVQRGKAGSGIVRFVSKDAIEFSGMTDRFMNG